MTEQATQTTQQATAQPYLTEAEHAIVSRRNSNMRQATADQAECLLNSVADFRLVFPSVAEVTEIVVYNGGMKPSGKETQNTTILLYIAMLGEETFNAIFDSTKISQADMLNLTPLERGQKSARHAVSIYRAMITVDKYAPLIPATVKFTRNEQTK